jgi:PAS domain S-box-containing protein
MNSPDFQVQGLGDPRLSVHATSARPAWLWSTDGKLVLWANPVGAHLFGAGNSAMLARKVFGPADPHRRLVARLAGRLPQNGAVRLERLRGFGAAPGMLATCACARLEFANGMHGVLITALASATRSMPLVERLQRLVQGVDTRIAAFASDGLFIGASEAARPLLGFRDLSEAGLDEARTDALKRGRVETPVGIGHMVLQRVGSGADIGLVALIVPGATQAAHVRHVAPEAPDAASDQPATVATAAREMQPASPAALESIAPCEQPALSGEAPVEFALFDALDPPEVTTQASAAPEPVQAEAEPTPVEAAQTESPPPEPSPTVETAAHEPPAPLEIPRPAPCAAADGVAPAPAASAPEPVKAPSWLDEPLPNTRRHPLRFMWQMNHEGRFSLGSDEFTRLIGLHTAAGLGRPWNEIAEAFGLDPEGRVIQAIATRDTLSGITLNWPVDGGGRLPVELSGLPIFDHARNFAGYRGFGVCRDLDSLARLTALRRYEFFSGPSVPASAGKVQTDPAEDVPAPGNQEAPPLAPCEEEGPQEKPQQDLSEPVAEVPAAAELPTESSVTSPATAELPEPIPSETSHQTDLEPIVDTPKELPTGMPEDAPEETSNDASKDSLVNVVPFRAPGEAKPPSLTPVENNAFNELARQLSARLESETGMLSPLPSEVGDGAPAQPNFADGRDSASEPPADDRPAAERPQWLNEPAPPPRGEASRDKALLDLMPLGVLIYRLDRLLYANRAFLDHMGYASLHALEQAGGLDALFVEPGVSSVSSTSDTGTPVTISASPSAGQAEMPAADAHLHTILWAGESALALIFSAERHEAEAPATEEAGAAEKAVAAPVPSAVGHANAEELGAILDTAAEGIVMFDAEGNLNSANRSAEALFGYDGDEFVRRNLADLFAPESQNAVFDYLAGIKADGATSLLDHGREVLGRVRQGGIVPLSITMGRTRADGPNFFAVFRDLTQAKKSESELREAKRLAERAANGKADMLARISHEVRTPLNAIIGFAEVMISERFGALGNERYVEYMKDIRASGERVISIINDLLDLSRIETGRLDLAFTHQNLNEMVESCVAVMQPQANRERIIIRSSLAHTLPPVMADARALRQITLNLIGNSIHLANAGGQVIVSTALSDFGEVMLRVRDTGQSLNDNEVAAALEPFRTPPPSDQASEGAGVSLSLTKALVEANRAKFQIKTGGRSGTLIEVVFSRAVARA